jgi:hypothetical protein
MYVSIIASRCFKTRSSVAPPFSPFYYLASVSSVGRWRQTPLAWADPTCLQVGTTSETWAGRHGTRDGGQQRRRPDVRMLATPY